MRTSAQILASYREVVKRKFFALIGRSTPMKEDLPQDPHAAWELGMSQGRKEGYGSGLVDGTQLGLDVGLDAVDEMLAQPVIFGSVGSA